MEVLTQSGCRVEARVVFACRAGNSIDVAVLETEALVSNGRTLMDWWCISSKENGCHGDRVTVAGYPLHQPSLKHCVPLLTSGCFSKVHYWEGIPVMYQVGETIGWLAILKAILGQFNDSCCR